MDNNQLVELLKENIDKVLSPTGYKHLLNRGNNLIRYDVLNRMFIECQYSKAFDLKTYDEWLIEGREIRSNQLPIYIVVPKSTTGYVDTQTGNVIDTQEMDLNVLEFGKALEYGIIKEVSDIQDIKVIPVYDIRQTKQTESTRYSVLKPKLSPSKILKLTVNVTGCTIRRTNKTAYSKKNNILLVNKQPYDRLASILSQVMAQYYMENKIKDIISEIEPALLDKMQEINSLILNSLVYAISTLLAIDLNISFDDVENLDNDTLVSILNIVDSIVMDIINKLEFNKTTHSLDITNNIKKLKKAEALLDIMEANKINNDLKGM